MAVFVMYLVLLLAMSSCTSATYCLCRDGMSQTNLQRAIDYACGNGADCSQILQNGPCYNPNTLRDHCSYAANSYYQRRSQVSGSCDFSGTAAPSQNAPSSQSSTCVYPSSSSNTGTPSNNNTSTITPPSGINNPSTTPGFSGGISPTGTVINDNSASVTTLHQTTFFLHSLTPTLLLSGLLYFMRS